MPTIRLKLGVGPNSINDAITSLSSGIFAPLYTGGAIEAQIAVATADQKSAVASYANRALKAFQEVENALSAEKILRKRYEYLKTTEKEYNIAYKMTVERYRIGESSVLDIIIVQGQWIAAEIARVQVAKKLLINRINLHLALGGSFK
jgi:outer membrane protein TolC